MIPLDNLRRVAIVVSVLPQDEVRQILMGLNEFQVTAVLRQITEVRDMPLHERMPVLTDFVKAHMQHGREELTAQPTSSISRLRYDGPVAQGPFQFLLDLPTDRVADELRAEDPDTVALILAHLPARWVSQLLQEISDPLKIETLRRLAQMSPVDRERIRDVERQLEGRLADCAAQPMARLGGVHFVAEVLRVADFATEGTLLDNLSQDDPQLGSVIRQSIVPFSDVFSLSDLDLRALIRHVETSHWAVALRGCDEPMVARITDNLSESEAESLRQQMQWLGPVRQAKVERVQAQIVDTLRRLRNARVVVVRDNLTLVDA